ncbi:hypothetical protein GW17_00000338 [Ensete ventricosum]|nr:hypothetical protein GW17_00000338 [Ensete ventricosum]RZR79929.1 hypothetical protein BHM03_00005807 [Ensete ventricosum]
MGAEADEDAVVDQGGDAPAEQRADPVHPVFVPGPADHRRAEGDGRVHGGAVERPACQDVGTHDEPDGEGRDDSQVALLGIYGRRVDRVHQPEGHHDLEHQRVPHGHAARHREGRCFLHMEAQTAAGRSCQARRRGRHQPLYRSAWYREITRPPVANLRSRQATTEPSSCAIQYKMPRSSVMLPPRKAPKVTAGLTWPPEMLAPTATATKRPNPWAKDAATTPAGVAEPSSVSLSAKTIHPRHPARFLLVIHTRQEKMELTERHPRSLAGKDEDEHGDELGESGLKRARVARLLCRSDRYAKDRHLHLVSRAAAALLLVGFTLLASLQLWSLNRWAR